MINYNSLWFFFSFSYFFPYFFFHVCLLIPRFEWMLPSFSPGLFAWNRIFSCCILGFHCHSSCNHHIKHHQHQTATNFQEVTLRKNNGDERIGLTVSYSSGNGSGSGSDDAETCTEVYISDIMVDSVAARDGRLRQGDQILQVRSIFKTLWNICRQHQLPIYGGGGG